MVPVYPIVYCSGIENAKLIALIVFVFAMVLDVVDGFIARKFNMITTIGKMLDPAADKCMVITVVATLVSDGILNKMFLYFVLAKELVMIFSGTFIYKKEKIHATRKSSVLSNQFNYDFEILCSPSLLVHAVVIVVISSAFVSPPSNTSSTLTL